MKAKIGKKSRGHGARGGEKGKKEKEKGKRRREKGRKEKGEGCSGGHDVSWPYEAVLL